MPRSLSRRRALIELSAAALSLAVFRRPLLAQGTPMVVYKDPSCGCCGKWIAHVQANGFKTSVTDSGDMPAIKKRYQVGDALRSCHTSIVGGYVIEGHVPAADIRRLLAQKPKVVGLAIPGMPASAPGMDMTPFQPYEVLSFDAAGKTAVFSKHTTA
jgi:hypothetical protein